MWNKVKKFWKHWAADTWFYMDTVEKAIIVAIVVIVLLVLVTTKAASAAPGDRQLVFEDAIATFSLSACEIEDLAAEPTARGGSVRFLDGRETLKLCWIEDSSTGILYFIDELGFGHAVYSRGLTVGVEI